MTTPASASKFSDPAEWVDRYGDALLQFACPRVGSRETAEDLVQETFLAAYKAHGEFDGRSAFSTWLIAILRRKIIDHYRKQARTPEVASVDLGESSDVFDAKGKWLSAPAAWRSTPADQAESSEFWDVLRRCLAELPTHLAQVFELRELGLATVDEASQLVGASPRNVSVRLHRARLLMRACLERKWFCAEPGELP